MIGVYVGFVQLLSLIPVYMVRVGRFYCSR